MANFCSNCGQKLSGSAFCPNCGTKVKTDAEQSAGAVAENEPDAQKADTTVTKSEQTPVVNENPTCVEQSAPAEGAAPAEGTAPAEGAAPAEEATIIVPEPSSAGNNAVPVAVSANRQDNTHSKNTNGGNSSHPGSVPVKDNTVGLGAYFGLIFVFGIPVIGWLICLIMAFVVENPNIKNFARARVLWLVITIIFSIISACGFVLLFGDSIYQILNSLRI